MSKPKEFSPVIIDGILYLDRAAYLGSHENHSGDPCDWTDCKRGSVVALCVDKEPNGITNIIHTYCWEHYQESLEVDEEVDMGKWVEVTADAFRLKVPGGWIYRTHYVDNKGVHPSTAFVPEPKSAIKDLGQAIQSGLRDAPYNLPNPYGHGTPFDAPPPGWEAHTPFPHPYQVEMPKPPTAADLKKKFLEQLRSPETRAYADAVLEAMKEPEVQRVFAALREAFAGAKACVVCQGSGEFQGLPCRACRAKDGSE